MGINMYKIENNSFMSFSFAISNTTVNIIYQTECVTNVVRAATLYG